MFSIYRSRWLIRLSLSPDIIRNIHRKTCDNHARLSQIKNCIGYVQIDSRNVNNLLKPYYENIIFLRSHSDSIHSSEKELDAVEFEKISEETLESLTEYFEELIEAAEHLQEADVSYSSGVLTVNLGDKYGTYVINRQTPNKQIWLSSPMSGPKRYNFINGKWIYNKDGKSLHELFDEEIPSVVKFDTKFFECPYSGH